MVSYAVAARVHETGIRLALGASPAKVVWLALRQGVTQTVVGMLLGTGAAVFLTRLMSGLLYEVQPGDRLTSASVVLGATAVATLASLLPARQAASVDPNRALRSE